MLFDRGWCGPQRSEDPALSNGIARGGQLRLHPDVTQWRIALARTPRSQNILGGAGQGPASIQTGPSIMMRLTAGVSPKAVIMILCCVRTQRENRCGCSEHAAAGRLENQPFIHRAARSQAAMIKSRTKSPFAAAAQRSAFGQRDKKVMFAADRRV